MKNLSKKLSCFLVALAAAFLFVTVAPLSPMGIENTSVAVAATKINVTKVNLPKGSSYKLQMTGTNAKVTWSTSNKGVATVNNGVVTGKKAGTAVITAKVGKKKYTCKVTVLGYKVNSNNVVMTKGKTYTLKLSGTSKKDKISYKSNKTSIVTVNAKTGKIYAKKSGTTTITVKVGKTSFPVTVKVETPTLNKTKLTLNLGATYSLKVNSSRKVTWKSNNTSVATVNSAGKIKALKNGSAVITATLSDRVLSCTVTVGGKNIIVCPDTITVGLGETVTYNITAGDSCTYSTANDFVECKVTPSYFKPGDPLTLTVIGQKVGNDTITFVSDNGWTKVVNVTVTAGAEIPSSTVSEVIDHVTISNLKANKGVNNNWINIRFSWTNNSPHELLEQWVTYVFYDAEGKEVDYFYVKANNPVQGQTYTCNVSFDPNTYGWTSRVASVKVVEVSGLLENSLQQNVVSADVPTTYETKIPGIELSEILLKQSYIEYSNKYHFDINFTLKNTSYSGTAYFYLYFFDKDGNVITQRYNKYIYKDLSPNGIITLSDSLPYVYGAIKDGDIASVKIVVYSSYQG